MLTRVRFRLILCFLITFPIFIYILFELQILNWYTNDDYFEEIQEYRNTEPKRMYVHSRDEIELTKSVILSPNCNNTSNNISVFIHSSAQSSGQYFERRQVLRKTWVHELKRHNICVHFVIALNINETINEELRAESEEYSDLLQFAFVDNYYNLTLKGISILRWIHQNCPKNQYILKTDDDVMVNIDHLLQKLNEFKTGISGDVLRRISPQRNVVHKWYVPHRYYPERRLPAYMNGPAYVMTNNISGPLIRAFDEYSGHVLDIDDLFITGILAESAGVNRYDTQLIQQTGCLDVCQLEWRGVTFGCETTQQMEDIWSLWLKTSSQFCRNVYFQKIFYSTLYMVIAFSLLVIVLLSTFKSCCYGFHERKFMSYSLPYKQLNN